MQRKAGAAFLVVVFVPNLADQLLDQVLQGDHAVGAAVFVDDDGDVLAGLPHPAQCRGQPQRAGEMGDVAANHRNRLLAPSGDDRLQQVAHVEEAGDVVEGVAVNRVPRVRAGDDLHQHLRDAAAGFEGVHVAAVAHQLGQRVLAGLEHLGHQLPLAEAEPLVGGHDFEDLVRRHGGGAQRRVEAHRAQQQRRGGVDDPDHRRHQFREQVQRRGDDDGDAFGLLHRNPLGHQFTEDEAQVRDEHGHQNQRERVGGAVGKPPPFQHRRKTRRQRGGAEGGGEEPGEGHADLHRGEEFAGIAGQRGDLLARPFAPLELGNL